LERGRKKGWKEKKEERNEKGREGKWEGK